MALTALRRVMPPPSDPVECGTWEDWLCVQAELGVQLPIDYKRFVNAYGTGQVNSFLYIFNPFSQNYHLNLVKQAFVMLSALRVVKAEFGLKEVPYPLYAEPGGLLPWGRTDNGDVLYWVTIGENPDKWATAINESRGPLWEEYPGYLEDILTKLLTGEVRSKIFDTNIRRKRGKDYALFTPMRG